MTKRLPLIKRVENNRRIVARKLERIGFDVHAVDGNPLFNLVVTGKTDEGEIYTVRVRVIVLSEVITLEELEAQAAAYPETLQVASSVADVLGWYGIGEELNG